MGDKFQCIRPIHGSLYRYRGVARLKPINMDPFPLTEEQRLVATKIALDIFTDCVNAAVTFQDAILAIYLSGLEHGSHAEEIRNTRHPAPALREKPEEER